MGEWINDHEYLSWSDFKGQNKNISYGGNRCTTKYQIQFIKKSVWNDLREQQKHANEEIDHYIERTWEPLLGKY